MSTPKEALLQRVRFTAAEPTLWLMHARTLRQAAEDLWVSGNAHAENPGSELESTVLAHWKRPEYVQPKTGGGTCDVCFLLFGFSLENLAKGIIVCNDPSAVTRTRLRNWHGKGHDLVKFFAQAHMTVDSDVLQTLVRTSRLSEWKGRYPVAMNFYGVDGRDRLIGHIVVSNIWPADEYARLCSIYEFAEAQLLKTMEEIPPLPADYPFGD